MKIQINTLCFQYWRRFFFCLSSLVEQIEPKPEISIRINTCLSNDKYGYMQRGTHRIFSKLLDLQWIDWKPDSGYDIRENIRNRDLAEINNDSDLMLWIDPDQIIDPCHFNYLFNRSNQLIQSKKVMSIARRDIPFDESNGIIKHYSYRRPVNNCLNIALNSNSCCNRRTIGAGYYQLVSVKTLKENSITKYSEYAPDRSMWTTSRVRFKTWSDIWFRGKLGVCKLKKCPQVYHLDHLRGNDRLVYFKSDSL